jgi:hypothetical protein
LCDSHVKVSQLAAMRFKHVVALACRKAAPAVASTVVKW